MFKLLSGKIIKFFSFKHSKQMLLISVLLFAIVFSLVKLLWAATPDPGHPWSGVGDGNFAVTGPTVPRTYTFPDASATVLTTANPVSVSQGGTGTSSMTGFLVGNGTNPITTTSAPVGTLVTTNQSLNITNKTINLSDNTLTSNSPAVGDLLKYFHGLGGNVLARGSAGQVLRVNSGGTALEWASAGSPAGSDTQLQYNNAGSLGATSSLTWSQSSKSLNMSGYLSLSTTTLPAVATTGTIKIFSQTVSGRNMLNLRSDESADYYAIQPSLYQNTVSMWAHTVGGTAVGIGTTPTQLFVGGGTFTDDVSEAGSFERVQAGPPINYEVGWGDAVAKYYRGSMTGRNGYFFFARLATHDDVTSVRFWAGLTDQTMTVALATDNPVGSRSGFAFSTALGESNWMFSNRGGGTEDRNSTGIAVATDKVYDLYFYNSPRGSTVTWRIDNLTDATTAEGSSSTSLPTSSVAMLSGFGVSNLVADIRSLKYQKIYVEVPR